ncbi:alpha/beta fold hydrolase [Paenibacillus sp. MMS20-IR301]|uniref:alpha/beta hydrolase n=1 Tax=Paenibacillus sp. MMS20-IR301 TaxID=2895946 RepID=UPI0028EA7311|nr:alpha/beta fold hydrolase [Paenibacillus sp. MMS20-IR301]WNS46093.1 alpha/beta fold hydrolase [Paenibacillus sp. MMS20-IR301]
MDKNIIERDFSCTRDSLTIRGTAFIPEGTELPAIIVSHGFGGNSRDLFDYCRVLAAWGYAAYCYDFCGGSAPGEGRSDGAATGMTVLTECGDLKAVMEYVKSQPYADAGKITLLGFSQGGFVSALSAAKHPDEVEALILIYPALCIPDDARKGALGGSSYDVGNVPDIIDCGIMKLGKRFHETVADMDPYEEITPYKGPVLLMHGTEDQVVDYKYAVKACDSYLPGQCQLQLIQEAGHSFTEQQSVSALVSIQQFLLGKKEILTIRVQITGVEIRKEEGSYRQSAVLFTGNSSSSFFTGHIMPGAVDVQEHVDDLLVSIRAAYTLEGTDYTGKQCRIHIVNQSVDGEWKPAIDTDSRALAFLNQEDLTAGLEGYTDGLTVRIYSAVPENNPPL